MRVRLTSGRVPVGERQTREHCAGLRKLSFHDLRHTYGSHLVRKGLDVVHVSRQLGHARPSITMDVYSHEFEEVAHADDVTATLTAAFGEVLS